MSGICGMFLILLLALINAFAETKIETWGLVALGFMVLIGTVAFGYFSLGKLPNLPAQIRDMRFSFSLPAESQPAPGPVTGSQADQKSGG